MVLKFLRDVEEPERGHSMLPDNFDFAMLPDGATEKTLSEIGMLESTIETIDYSITSWLKNTLSLSAHTNEGFVKIPVIWQTAERSFQIKEDLSLRDDADGLILPVMSIERTAIVKDPMRKGSFQAHLFSNAKNGRSGRMVLAKRIKQDKTRNFAVAAGTRTDSPGTRQRYTKRAPKRLNKKVVIQTLSIPIPVYINVEYKITIKTEYQQQMNEILTPFIGRTGQINSFILRRDGHLYEAFIDQNFNHSNNIANLDEEMRMYTTDINIRILGYLIGEGENDDRPIVRIEENTVELSFPKEEAGLPGQENIFGIKTKPI